MKRSRIELEQEIAKQEAAMEQRAATLASTIQSADAFQAALLPMAQQIGQLRQQLRERTPRRELRAHRRELRAMIAQASAEDRPKYVRESEQIDFALLQRGHAGAQRLLVFAFALFGAIALALAVLSALHGPP